MIYITGDTHGYYHEFMDRIKPLQLTAEDTVIVTGDFGFIHNTQKHADAVKKLLCEDFTICFVDGNHENFDLLETFPTEEWNGGKVHRIGENIIHLMRGQLYTIEEKTFFTMGGAYSIDKAARTEGISWWKQELPTPEDYHTASDTLKKCGYKADYVLTHTVPDSIIHRMGIAPDPHDAELTGFLEWVSRELDFKEWYAGHFHENAVYADRFHVLYEDVVKIG